MRGQWLLAAALGLGMLGVVSPAACGGDAAPDAAKAEREKWAEHMGDLPFVIGYEKGMKEVEFTGKPPMYFFTATW